ncbi:MAG TPA: xanthine dehydrogenase family protein subunit M [Saprospiraceae bacterium]|nr:xanthine dehydrogenase family protein subunit M [Saprospiraceae bacterium]HPI07831.1 xanthine dehydrogenase family protein subunit M [Saprospiraceae bacterium]
MHNFFYTRANSIEEAIDGIRVDSAAKYVAGGTNLIDLLKYNIERADVLVDVNHVEVFPDAEQMADGCLRLSAFMTNADTAYHPLVEKKYPLLSEAILAGASAQIRNMATNGGNLLQRTRCYYFYDPAMPCNKREPGSGCPALNGYNRMMAILGTSSECIAVFPSDMCVALAALGAVVEVEGPSGQRHIPFSEFHRLPGRTPHLDNNLEAGEIITAICLPPEGFSRNYAYLKLRDRNSYAFALVSVALALEMDGECIREARIALGGVAHKPWRVPDAEDFLQGREATPGNFAAAADLILQGAQAFEHNGFKIELAKKAIVRAGKMALHPETHLPGAQPPSFENL